LKRNDLWGQVDNGLEQFFKQNPELEKSLMDVPLEPVNQHYRGSVHLSRGETEAAQVAFDIANKGLYSENTIQCLNSQMNFLINEVSQYEGPIVDLASGACGLVSKMLKDLSNLIVVTDFSPSVLVKNRNRLMEEGLYNRATLSGNNCRILLALSSSSGVTGLIT